MSTHPRLVMLCPHLQNVDSLPAKVALTKGALSSFPREYVECHFNAPASNLENDFEKSLAFAFENEAWLRRSVSSCE